MSTSTPSAGVRPLVSVVTPTYGRETMLPAAYRCFASQDVADSEWIVLDDSDTPSAFLASLDDPRVRYRHLPSRLTIGEKRNIANDMARADVIAHFDDDEYYAPHYLRTMLASMDSQQADFAKLSAFFLYSHVYRKFGYWDLLLKEGPHLRWSPAPMTVVTLEPGNGAFRDNHLGYGFSYCYRKSVWAGHPFPHQQFNEDGEFIVNAVARGTRVALLQDDAGLCVHVLHQSNTSICFPQYVIPDVLVQRLFPGMPDFV
ncbi:glycosyltransferase family 2 protein [Burkholderia guangdongensis]|uniref:glycosyltransferase family 2 protein n=1 Tax=Burkholderia guangdongensis TaxID=1792500 RepID=UPI0015CEC61B|nr:glycosyltransferase family A protein [Burkholderia guangdongensis]